jgi:hypothetical protein
MHRSQIPDFGSVQFRFYIHQNSQYGVLVKCRQHDFLRNGYTNHNGDAILHLCHSNINRIWSAISVQFTCIIISHTAFLSPLSKFYIVDDLTVHEKEVFSDSQTIILLNENSTMHWDRFMLNDEEKIKLCCTVVENM